MAAVGYHVGDLGMEQERAFTEAETIHREGKCQHQSPNLKSEIQIKWHVHH